MHFINAIWSNVSCILDLKVFKGTKTGEAVYNDIAHLLLRATIRRSFLTVLESQIPQATWASWDNIAMRTEGGMGTVQIITSIVMLSLLLMVSTCGNGGGQESWPAIYFTLSYIGCMLTIVVDNCLIIFCQHRFYTHILIPAKNIALVASAVGYFESSTQAMTKLLDFQHTSHLSIYKDQHRPKKPLQDVVTRWGSTYCSITHLRFLKKAIRSLLVVGDIECDYITKEEWLVLDQLQILLETMAHFQRILEGESHVTGSLVAVAVFQIRQEYVEVIVMIQSPPSCQSSSHQL